MIKARYTYRLFIFFTILFCTSSIQAQLPLTNNKEEQEEVKTPEDVLGRGTPRGSVSGFIDAMANRSYTRGIEYLNFPEDINSVHEKEHIVKVLQRLFDQKGNLQPISFISDDPLGKTDDALDPKLEKVGTVKPDNESIEIFLEQQEDENGQAIWLFSSKTISAVSSVSIQNSPLVEQIMPNILERYLWGGVPVGQWLVALALIILSYLASFLIISGLIFLLKTVWKKATTNPVSGVLSALSLPLKLYSALWIFVLLSRELGLSIILRQRFSTLTIITAIAAILILLWRLSEFLGKYSQNRMLMRGNATGVSVVLFLQRMAKITIVTIGIIAILGAVGIDVTTGLAALGIGGIALALGAQKTIENFVGSVTLIADRPIRVGDYCKVGDITGTIENIGIRSTRIRTLDRTRVTIPNGTFSSDVIENYAFRDKFKFYDTLSFRKETTPNQLRFLLTELRKVLYAHPKVYEDPARIRFVGITANSKDLEIFAYLEAADYSGFLAVKEDIMLRMLDVVNRSGTDFAFPSQTVYFGKDAGLSKEKSVKAEAEVENLRNDKEMPLPEFTREQIEALRNQLKYPPEGSSNENKN